MYSFQNFIVWLIPNHPLPLETRIWKLVVRALLVYSRRHLHGVNIYANANEAQTLPRDGLSTIQRIFVQNILVKYIH